MAESPSTRPNGKPDTGEVCYDLPSPYLPHAATGLLHLPRFLAKIRKALAGELPKSYQRNYCKGFDRFLCEHLGLEPEQVVEAVQASSGEADLEELLRALLPADVRATQWNRRMVQLGLRGPGRESLDGAKAKMGIAHREDLQSFADMIEFDEDRLD